MHRLCTESTKMNFSPCILLDSPQHVVNFSWKPALCSIARHTLEVHYLTHQIPFAFRWSHAKSTSLDPKQQFLIKYCMAENDKSTQNWLLSENRWNTTYSQDKKTRNPNMLSQIVVISSLLVNRNDALLLKILLWFIYVNILFLNSLIWKHTQQTFKIVYWESLGCST